MALEQFQLRNTSGGSQLLMNMLRELSVNAWLESTNIIQARLVNLLPHDRKECTFCPMGGYVNSDDARAVGKEVWRSEEFLRAMRCGRVWICRCVVELFCRVNTADFDLQKLEHTQATHGYTGMV